MVKFAQQHNHKYVSDTTMYTGGVWIVCMVWLQINSNSYVITSKD